MSINKILIFLLIAFTVAFVPNKGEAGLISHFSSNNHTLEEITNRNFNLSVESFNNTKNYNSVVPSKPLDFKFKDEKALRFNNSNPTNYAFAFFEKTSPQPRIYKIQAISKAENYLGFRINPSAETDIKNDLICFSIYDLQPELLKNIYSDRTLIFALSDERFLGSRSPSLIKKDSESTNEAPDHPPVPFPFPMPYTIPMDYTIMDEDKLNTTVEADNVIDYKLTWPNKQNKVMDEIYITLQWIQVEENLNFSALFQNFGNYLIPCEKTLIEKLEPLKKSGSVTIEELALSK